MIADVWESRKAFEEFFSGSDVAGAIRQTGVTPGEPQFSDVHNLIRQGAGTEPRVLVLIEADELTPEVYDDLISRMPAHAGDGSAHPAVSHVAARSESGGLRFVDVWDSPESFGQFAQTQIADAAEGAELPAMETRFVPIHNRMAAPA